MDLLIELVAWLFRQFFGEPEKPVDVGRHRSSPTRSSARPRRRGPYVYGDETPQTLESILEEVRREAEQKRQGTGVENPASQQIAPEVRPKRQIAEVELHVPQAEPEVHETLMQHELPSSFEPQAPDVPEGPAAVPPQALPPEPAWAPSIIAYEALPEIVAVANQKSKILGIVPVETVGQSKVSAFMLLKNLRAGTREQRRAAGQQAFILCEVLGPPKSAVRNRRRPVAVHGAR